ncbi:MAG: cupredoxin family copper-binding protein [Steroidobacterales bacterium]
MLITELSRARRPVLRAIALSLCVLCLSSFAGGGLGLASEPAAAVAAPAAAGPVSQAHGIAIRNFMFAPMSLEVPIGTTVSWTNYDPEPHTIRSVDDTFRSGALDQNESFSFRFDKAGSYKYTCSIHPQMVATIVVK